MEEIKTIKDLYEWACKNHVEDYHLFVYDYMGMSGEVNEEISYAQIYEDEKTIIL